MHDWSKLHRFWFGEITSDPSYHEKRSKIWFAKDSNFDAKIRSDFAPWLDDFESGRLGEWKRTPKGYISLVVLLDQVPRNTFRNSARAYAYDEAGLKLSMEAIGTEIESKLCFSEKLFLYLPLEHSESLEFQLRSVELFTKLDQQCPQNLKPSAEEHLDFALRHKVIIERFGRFPHRNRDLGRTSTGEEIEFLSQPGSGF